MKSVVVVLLLSVSAFANGFGPKELNEATIAQIHEAMKGGKLTSVELVQLYLDRMKAYDKQGPFVNDIVQINSRFVCVRTGDPSPTTAQNHADFEEIMDYQGLAGRAMIFGFNMIEHSVQYPTGDGICR